MFYPLETRVSHACWRRFVKREQRRQKRQRLAVNREAATEHLASLHTAEELEEQAAILRQEQLYRRTEWHARDLACHSLFLHHKAVSEEKERKNKEQQELIRKEWEEKEKQEAEAKQQASESPLLQQARLSLLPATGSSSNPEPPRAAPPPPNQELCPFFGKTGACRFGDRCSRVHVQQTVSRTVLVPHMYAGPGELPDTHHGGSLSEDTLLEHDEQDRREHFRCFFEDLCSEAGKHGGLEEVRVCCNTVAHLRGNVYLRYHRTSDAMAAAAAIHGRYYAGRVVTCTFVGVLNFRSAICGLYWRNQCHKGGSCNFLHPHPNPGNRYTGGTARAAGDRYSSSSWSRRSYSSSTRSTRSERLSRSPESIESRSRLKSDKRTRSSDSRSYRRSYTSSASSHKRSRSPDSRSRRMSRSPDSTRSNRRSRSPKSRSGRRSSPDLTKSHERSSSPDLKQSHKTSRPSNSKKSKRRSRSPSSRCHRRSRSPDSKRSRRRSRSPNKKESLGGVRSDVLKSSEVADANNRSLSPKVSKSNGRSESPQVTASCKLATKSHKKSLHLNKS